MRWVLNEADEALLDLALKEDMGEPYYDATTAQVLSDRVRAQSHRVTIISKHATPVVVSGECVMHALMQRLTPDFSITMQVPDGDTVAQGGVICTLLANAGSVLMAERTLLNFLRHLCAVATLTRQFVEAVAGTALKILDTRKTMPGLRHLEKYAVHCGGGVNHRMGLYDAIMIKNNHVDLMGGMVSTLAALPADGKLPVIVEVRSLAELQCVLEHALSKVDRVLLDNMNVSQLKECVKLCAGRIETEASGNLNLETIRAVADTGVDYASVGALTHSAGNVDLSLRVVL